MSDTISTDVAIIGAGPAGLFAVFMAVGSAVFGHRERTR